MSQFQKSVPKRHTLFFLCLYDRKLHIYNKPDITNRAHGKRVHIVKHDVHGYDFDRTGSDSDRFAKAGADHVVLFSERQILHSTNLKKTDGINAEEVITGIKHVDQDVTVGDYLFFLIKYPVISDMTAGFFRISSAVI